MISFEYEADRIHDLEVDYEEGWIFVCRRGKKRMVPWESANKLFNSAMFMSALTEAQARGLYCMLEDRADGRRKGE